MSRHTHANIPLVSVLFGVLAIPIQAADPVKNTTAAQPQGGAAVLKMDGPSVSLLREKRIHRELNLSGEQTAKLVPILDWRISGNDSTFCVQRIRGRSG